MNLSCSSEKLLFTAIFGFTFFILASALQCFSCEGEDCEEGGGYQVDCPRESSICVRYVDVTGRALKKGPGAVYRRQCGASWQGIEGCRQATVNFDICFCSTDMCNGEEGAPILIPTTKAPPSTTMDPNAENSTSTDLLTTTEPDEGFEPADPVAEQEKVDSNTV